MQANNTALDFVKPYDTVNFKGGTGIKVTPDTNGATSTITIGLSDEYKNKIDSATDAAVDKGLQFAGDSGAEVHKKLGEKLDIIGGADTKKLSDKNIGVTNKNDKLVVELAKDIIRRYRRYNL